jgi:uncharacterized protein (TIGR00299 family) protein
MPIAILDPFAGISGDMTLGALLDAGVARDWLEGLPARLGFADVTVQVRRVERGAVAATKVDFTIPPSAEKHGRHLNELLQIVREAPISESVRARATRAFELIGDAEGRVHGVRPADIHLHEVGAVDAVLDIVGAIEGFERLGVDGIYHLPVAIGTGWVDTAHGKLPVPAPATAILLEGIDLRHGGPITGEATTPTGAALLKVLSQGRPPDRWRGTLTGWGAGERDPDGYPNALRLVVAEGAPEAGIVEVIATDIDDMPPEYVEPLREALLATGAVDCAVWATFGKKGRPALRVEIQVPHGLAERVLETLFAHSTTAGARRWVATRSTLPRRELSVELSGAVRVRVKVWDGPFGTRLKAEYGDVVAAAAALQRPAIEVAREAERLADVAIEHG